MSKQWTLERQAENDDSPYEIGEEILLSIGSIAYVCTVVEVEDGNLIAFWCPETRQRIAVKQTHVN